MMALVLLGNDCAYDVCVWLGVCFSSNSPHRESLGRGKRHVSSYGNEDADILQ